MPKYNRRAWQQDVVKRQNHPPLLEPGEGIKKAQAPATLRTARQELEIQVANNPDNKSLKSRLSVARLQESHFKESRKAIR